MYIVISDMNLEALTQPVSINILLNSIKLKVVLYVGMKIELYVKIKYQYSTECESRITVLGSV